MAITFIKGIAQLEGQKRIDAEYYQPEYAEIRHRLKQINTKRIRDISTSVVSFGAYSLCNYIIWRDEGIPYLNVENVRAGYIDLEQVKHIDEDVNEILKKSQVREGQVILTMAGTIGNAAVAYKLPEKINSNQAIAKITLKPNISPFFLAAFLNSYFGKKQTEWEIVTSVQPNIFLWQIENIRIPVITKQLEEEIEKAYKQGLDQLHISQALYSQAKILLLKELGLGEFMPRLELSYIERYSKAFAAHRIDAEYFQPTYHKLIERLTTNYKLSSLQEFLLDFRKGVEVGSNNYQEEGIPFIRVSNLSVYGFIDGDPKYISEELYGQLKDSFEPREGELLLTKDATPGIAYIAKDHVQGIISSGITRLRIDETKIDKEYLTLCINSVIGQLQIKRDGGGSVITHWRPEQIKRLQIPILPDNIQREISSLVQQSYEARNKARELLNIAKRKVESVIQTI